MSRRDGPGAKLRPDHPFFPIVQDAYKQFSSAKPTRLEVCECCIDADVERDFFNPPIDQLPLAYIRNWYFADHGPGISKPLWAYVLPRILEILAIGQQVSEISPEISLARFPMGQRHHWSTAQWDVLDRFQRAFLQRTVEHGRGPVDETLCMFALAGWPVEELIEQLDAMPDALLAEALWRDWCKGSAPGREAVWVTSFWKGDDASTVYRFYMSDRLRERMTALAMAEDMPSDTAEKALAVAAVIEKEAGEIRH